MSTILNIFPKVIRGALKEYRKKRFDKFELIENADGGKTSGHGRASGSPKAAAASGAISFDNDTQGLFAFGDNASFMKQLKKEGFEGKIKQIYIDPPFFSKADYDARLRIKQSDGEKIVKSRAYEDTWEEGMEEYLKMLTLRLMLMKDLLTDDGTIWVHLDWHGVHYVKIIMDEIFGEKNFVNEIVWTYKSGGASKKHFARKHDTILVYSKTQKYYLDLPKEKSYNRGYKPYRFKGVEEFRDELGWYTMVNMKDVWSIDMVGRTSAERNGYATQKPEALLERILLAGSEEGNLVADFFAGSSTLGAAAEKNGRKWICTDESPVAFAASLKRLVKNKDRVSVMIQKATAERAAAEGENTAVEETPELQVTLFPEEDRYTFKLKSCTVSIDAGGHMSIEE